MNEITQFEQKYLQAFKDLAHLEALKKSTESKCKNIRAELESAMDKYGITKIDNEFLSITRVPENPGKLTVDLDAFKKAEPEEYEGLLEDYPKTTGAKKSYIKITVKEGKDNG